MNWYDIFLFTFGVVAFILLVYDIYTTQDSYIKRRLNKLKQNRYE